MKTNYALLAVSALLVVSGCSTAPKTVRLDPVGPNPSQASATSESGRGYLRVYSAKERAPIDVNATEYFWNNDFGRNDFLLGASHTPYVICNENGAVLRRVLNRADPNEAVPMLIELPAGDYQVRADAKEYNDVARAVIVPVTIRGGMTTAVHLDGNWQTVTASDSLRVVLLPNGNPVGWRSMAYEGSDNPQNPTGR